MISGYQTCRICGVDIPSGFTNCDGCYHKTDFIKTEAAKILETLLKGAKLPKTA